MVFKSEFKGAIMNRGLVKFISLFIFDKEKKQAFRIKYDAIERLRQRLSNERGRINALEYNLGMLAFKVLPHISVDYLHGLNANQVSSLDEHKQNVEALKANLEEESLYNLNKILNTIEKRKYSKIFLPENFYTEEEFEAYKAHVDMEYEIQDYDEYIQYKNFKLPKSPQVHFYSNVFVDQNGMQVLKTLEKMDENAVIIDGGGYVLDSALIFREFCSHNKIISFEPVKDIYALGQKTIQLNNLHNIVYENMALGNRNSEQAIEVREHGGSTLCTNKVNGDASTELCKTICLDDYVKKYNLKVGLIKTDVEGFEQQLLDGAINTIKEQKPILLISIYHNYHDFYKIKPWLESLNLGYKFNFFKGCDGHPSAEILLIGEVY